MKLLSEENKRFFHIYNRGVDKRTIFKNHLNYLHFFELIKNVNQLYPIGSLYRSKQNENQINTEIKEKQKLVEIISYSLLPNHYHLLLRELVEGGVSKFMQKIGTGYTNYFNLKNKRSGSLFQGRYKSIEVNSEEYLNYLSAYINGNSEIHGICKAKNYKYSNYNVILFGGADVFNKHILKNFSKIEEYQKYVKEVIKNSKKIKKDKKRYLFE